jgi:hypothetical protein
MVRSWFCNEKWIDCGVEGVKVVFISKHKWRSLII